MNGYKCLSLVFQQKENFFFFKLALSNVQISVPKMFANDHTLGYCLFCILNITSQETCNTKKYSFNVGKELGKLN